MTRRLLFSIAHNALTNAFRHADASKVTIHLSFEDDGLRMSVSDDGTGLPEGYAERGHGFRNMRADAERMGGRLEVASGRVRTRHDCNLRYSVWPSPERRVAWRRSTHTSVMLVDDHEIMRDGLREVLHRSGDFEVVGEAGDGETAVRVAQELKPDVIVMDVMMPMQERNRRVP